MPPVGNLYPNSGNRPKKVEKPRAADRKSLPKQRKIAEKGREAYSCRPEISTQTAEIGRKGRESQCLRSEISTQTAGNSRKGRDSCSRRLEISTQIENSGRKGRESNFRRLNPYGTVSSHPPASPAHIFSIVSSHILLQASLGMRRSPLGEMATEPTLGPSGRQERLNCWLKKRR